MNKTIVTIAIVFLLSLSFASTITISDVSTSPSEIQPGQTFNLEIKVENILDKDVKEVVVSLDLSLVPFAPHQSSNEVRKEELDEDDSKTFEFDLISSSDTDSGTYKIPVTINYELDSVEKTATGLVSVTINAKPNLDLSLESSPLIKGRNSELSIRVTNSGLGEARLLSLRVIPISGLKLISSGNVYIGDIESDDFDNADFSVSLNSNSASIINLPIEISYRDSRNKEFTETKYLPIKAYSEDEALELGLIQKSNTTTYFIVILALVVLWWLWRRRKRKQRLEGRTN